MTRARAVFALQGVIAVLAMTVVAIALEGLFSSVTLAVPSARELAGACGRFALPDASLASVASLGLGSAAVAVLLFGIRSAVRQLRASRRFVTQLGCVGEVVGPREARVFRGSAPQAFCAGLFRPTVYVSSSAVERLSERELDAVLAHESHHARVRDPLRILFARVLGDAVFFLPGVRQLGDRYQALAEVAADRAAVRAAGDRGPLASALLVFESADPAVVGVAPERVDSLLGESPAWQLPAVLLAWTVVLLSVVGVVALRLDQAAAHTELSLPLVAAETCMLMMAVVPLMLGAAAMLGAKRILWVRRSG